MVGSWPFIFVAGFFSSAHCIGMCGGIAAAVGASCASFRAGLARQLVYSLGRVCTYAFLGALAGALGQSLTNESNLFVVAQRLFSVLAGLIMILVGASILGLIGPRRHTSGALALWFVPMLRHYTASRSLGGGFLAGLTTGFLPCGLVYAFLAHAVTTGHPADGAAVMTCFGAGTIPAMLTVGLGATVVTYRFRLQAYRMAALLILVAGGVTIWRAVPVLRHAALKHDSRQPAGAVLCPTGTDAPPTSPTPNADRYPN